MELNEIKSRIRRLGIPDIEAVLRREESEPEVNETAPLLVVGSGATFSSALLSGVDLFEGSYRREIDDNIAEMIEKPLEKVTILPQSESTVLSNLSLWADLSPAVRVEQHPGVLVNAISSRSFRMSDVFTVMTTSPQGHFKAALEEKRKVEEEQNLRDYYEKLIGDIQEHHRIEFNALFYGALAIAIGIIAINVTALLTL